MTKDIKEIAKEIEAELINIRRHLHQYPELGFKEYTTSAYICHQLTALGITYTKNVGGTGVLATIKGRRPGSTVMLRADMDGLSMMELADVPYKSKTKGQMHACGHDGHVTWLLGAAMILKKLENEICGCVKFIFQPAEEGLGGAQKVIEEGILENPKVDTVIGAHIWPGLPAGAIGIKYGGIMAASTFFSIKIKGKGGHGAEPHKTVDPISIGAQIYMALQTIVSRMSNPTEAVVLSITQFHSGTAHNIIPDEAELSGTVRTVSDEMNRHVELKMKALIKGIVEANGGSYDFVYKTYYPAVINNESMVDLLKNSATKIVGKEQVHLLTESSMAGEDFSFYAKKVPSVFFFVGSNNEEKGLTNALHSPYFDLDEGVLSTAASVMAQATLDYLHRD